MSQKEALEILEAKRRFWSTGGIVMVIIDMFSAQTTLAYYIGLAAAIAFTVISVRIGMIMRNPNA